ncbi:MAG TPA: DUF512 domain-containing protein [Longimicrobiales bacterium]|nr:DUF512 domain-containing protein [Longimicrobiales bacterium]
MVRIAEVVAGSIADELQLEIGSRVIRINGERVRDGIDFRFLEVDGQLELEVVTADGDHVLYDIEKDEGESLGIVPAPDTIRECANKCVFCFIDGNPAGVRPSLNLRDDDFRLSFNYGSYVTLTNLGPRGFQRLIDQRLSPLYVSVHATEPEIRMRLLGVPRGGEIVEQLQRLTEAGIEVHTQVVLCPEWNDGEHLERTIDDLWSIGPRVLSLSVVPVGLTRYNLNRPVRLLTPDEARAAIATVERARRRALDERGVGWVYAADEMFYIAGEPIPPAGYYDDWPLMENGVGAVRQFLDDAERVLRRPRRLAGRRIGLVTGTRMAGVMAPAAADLSRRTGATIDVLDVENEYFGSSVNVAGLLAGSDIERAVSGVANEYDTFVIPARALNDDDCFIDSLPLARLEEALRPARVVRALLLSDAMSQL